MSNAHSTEVQLVLDLALARTIVLRDVDRRLTSNGVALNDLALLLELYQAPGHKMRRLDLAERLGVTASGVTRQIMPLEKIGMVGRESTPGDARMALAVLTDAGVRTVEEVLPDTHDAAVRVLDKRWTADEQRVLHQLLGKLRDE